MNYCLFYQRRHICSDSQEEKKIKKNCPIFLCACVCSCNLINHHFKNHQTAVISKKTHLTPYINRTGLTKFRQGKNKSGSLNDEFAVCHNMRARVIMPPFLPSSLIDSLSEKDIIGKKSLFNRGEIIVPMPWQQKRTMYP